MLISVKNGASKTIAASTTSAQVTLDVESQGVVIANDGTQAAFIRIGLGTQTAVATDFCVLGGQSVVLAKPSNHLNVAALTAASTTSIKVAPVDVLG
jgi:hypothetical protein